MKRCNALNYPSKKYPPLQTKPSNESRRCYTGEMDRKRLWENHRHFVHNILMDPTVKAFEFWCANVLMCRCANSFCEIALKNSHICTLAHSHIKIILLPTPLNSLPVSNWMIPSLWIIAGGIYAICNTAPRVLCKRNPHFLLPQMPRYGKPGKSKFNPWVVFFDLSETDEEAGCLNTSASCKNIPCSKAKFSCSPKKEWDFFLSIPLLILASVADFHFLSIQDNNHYMRFLLQAGNLNAGCPPTEKYISCHWYFRIW